MKKFPDFIVAGVLKCGTTSLHQSLNRHPQIWMPQGKEPNFFNKHYQRGRDYYSELFKAAHEKSIKGEASVTYSQFDLYPGVANRIHESLPDVKLIFMVRDPLKQIVSHWKEVHKWSSRSVSFHEMLYGSKLLLNGCNYRSQVQCFERFFPPERIRVFTFEDYICNPRAAMTNLFEFLGVDASIEVSGDPEWRNKSAECRAPTKLLSFAEQAKLAPLMRKLMPLKTRKVFHGLTRKELPKFSGFSDEEVRYIKDNISRDLGDFVKRYGLDTNQWDASLQKGIL